MEKALIGMSGGVDSSVAALLTKKAGYACIGATGRFFSNDILGRDQESSCCSLDDAEDARAVARRLGIPHYVFNFQDAFRTQVLEKFVHCYESGGTPSPCIDCNRYLKFGVMLQRAQELGCSYVVTGHYARIRRDPETGLYLLYKAADKAKDQSYFLYPLTQNMLEHTLFPLGELTKPEVRALAEENGFVTARKHDSQDICFVPYGDYVAFMERFTGKTYPAGNYLDAQGHIVGQHCGAVRYTIGQRKGLGIALGEPVYVCAKDMTANTVTVGPNEALFAKGLRANDWNWFPFPSLTAPMEVSAKIRNSRTEYPATVIPEDDGFARVLFRESARAVSPGQAVVLYQDDLVIGGGTITEAIY